MSNFFTQSGSHSISLTAAVELTHRFQNNRNAVFKTGFEGALSTAETFNKNEVLNMLSVNGAAGLRIYYGLDESNAIHAVLVAVDADGEDIVPAMNTVVGEDENVLILEEGVRCPPSCPADSPLIAEP